MSGHRQVPVMPRTSPFVIKLTKKELVSRSRKYTSPYRDVIRAKIVLLASRGLSNDAIAARLDTPRQVVGKWRRRFHAEAHDGSITREVTSGIAAGLMSPAAC